MIKAKPVPKSEVAISNIFPDDRNVFLWATNDAMSEFVCFGSFFRVGFADKYCLTIDPRFDFDEVVEYIRNYGKGENDG